MMIIPNSAHLFLQRSGGPMFSFFRALPFVELRPGVDWLQITLLWRIHQLILVLLSTATKRKCLVEAKIASKIP